MTNEEAETMCKILLTADGGCGPCVKALFTQFLQEFPETVLIAKKVFMEAGNYFADEQEWQTIEREAI